MTPCCGSPAGATLLPTTQPYQYTPLIDKMPDFFNVKLNSITVGRTKLDIPASDFDTGYGTVLDSGTTFNYLPGRTYLVMRSAIERAVVQANMLQDHRWDASPGDVCYINGPADFKGLEKELPTFNLNLEGGAVLVWPPMRYLYYMSKGRYCLGIFDNGRDGFIVGALGSRNLLMRYEVADKRLGFAEADCTALGVAAATGKVRPCFCRNHAQHAGCGAGSARKAWLRMVATWRRRCSCTQRPWLPCRALCLPPPPSHTHTHSSWLMLTLTGLLPPLVRALHGCCPAAGRQPHSHHASSHSQTAPCNPLPSA